MSIGEPAARIEDRRLITGAGAYTADVRLEGEVHAAFARSPYAHARIAHIDTAAAAAAPGVLAVLTWADIAAEAGTMENEARWTNRGGTPVAPTPLTLLADDKVRFMGEPVAMVIAESAAAAKDAAELVDVDYLPLVAAGDIAAAPGAPAIWDHVPGNLAFEWEDGDEQACAAAFARAARTVSITVRQNKVAPSPMETRGAIGAYDAARDAYLLYTGSQGAYRTRERVAKLIGAPAERLRVVTPDVGGAFGQKAMVTPELGLVLIAARRVGRPVKWIAERIENLGADSHGRAALTEGVMAFDADGRITALRVSNRADLGAYMSQIGPGVSTAGGYRILGGLYRVPVAHARTTGYYTNTASLSAYRGAGRPEAAYLVDRLLDLGAAEFGIDRLEIRRRNLPAAADFPRENWKGIRIDSGDCRRVLDEAATLAGWDSFAERRAASRAQGRLRGIGVAYYLEMTAGGPQPDQVMIRLRDDGGANVWVGSQASGQGHDTAHAQIVAEKLGLPLAAITIRQGDTADDVSGQATVGARTLHSIGPALVDASAAMVARLGHAAAQVLQAAPDRIVFAIEDGAGRFAVAGAGSAVTVAELGRLAGRRQLPGFEEGVAVKITATSAPTFPNGCHIAEVEIDPETGEAHLISYVAVDDLGRRVNPMTAAGQVVGGIVQGLGQALLEELVYDDNAQLVTATFQDYALPRAADVPEVRVASLDTPCTTNPLGVKGAGEAGITGALQAVMSAVADALGVSHLDMPATPERVWRALRKES